LTEQMEGTENCGTEPFVAWITADRRLGLFRIAIQPDNQLLTSSRRKSFSERWAKTLRDVGHKPCLVDASKPDFFDRVATSDGFMWWYAHLAFPRNFARRLVPAVEHGIGIPYRTARYLLVTKSSLGITSENVRLLRDFAEARHWIGSMLGPGLVKMERATVNGPRAAAKRARGWLLPLLRYVSPRPGSLTELQWGYLLLQEFVPGNEFDTRVTVIGDRAFAFRRLNRPTTSAPAAAAASSSIPLGSTARACGWRFGRRGASRRNRLPSTYSIGAASGSSSRSATTTRVGHCTPARAIGN
jgi:hypothetical protein